MKLLIYIEYFYPHIGGVERVFFEVGRRLASKGSEVTILTTDEGDTDKYVKKRKVLFGGLVKEYKIEGMRVVKLLVPRLFKRYLFPIVSLPFAFVISRKADLIHSANNYTVALPCFILAKILGKPVTVSVWEIWDKSWYIYFKPYLAVFYWLYEIIVLNLPFDFFFSPSTFIHNKLKNIPNKEKIYLAGRNLKYDIKARKILRRKFNTVNKFVYLYYGRLGISKGAEILIKAIADIAEELNNICFIIFSPDYKDKKIGKIIQSVNSSKRGGKASGSSGELIKLYSEIPESELASYLSIADSIVIPDLSASFGITALEASQMGIPVISTTAGALPEVVYGKVNFTRPGDSRGLAVAMKKAYKGEFNKVPKKNFSWDRTAEKYEKVFLKIINYNKQAGKNRL